MRKMRLLPSDPRGDKGVTSEHAVESREELLLLRVGMAKKGDETG